MELQDKPDWIERCKLIPLKGGGTVHLYRDAEKSLVLCSGCVKRGPPGAPLNAGTWNRTDGVTDSLLICPVSNCGSHVTMDRSEMEMLGLPRS